MSELKTIDLNQPSFEANGKTYTIEGGLSIERYAEFQILEKELAYGLTVKGMFDKINDGYQLLNQQRFADAAVLMNNLMRGVSKMEEREPVILKICALFCNTEGEDRTVINDDMITAKIGDWKKEGIDFKCFFQLASSSVSGLLEIYRSVTQAISGNTE